MDDRLHSAEEPTAANLKQELRESLEILKKDFDSLKHFVDELASNEVTAPLSLTSDDLNDLLSITQEVQDAANDIEFEAGKIRDILTLYCVRTPQHPAE